MRRNKLEMAFWYCWLPIRNFFCSIYYYFCECGRKNDSENLTVCLECAIIKQEMLGAPTVLRSNRIKEACDVLTRQTLKEVRDMLTINAYTKPVSLSEYEFRREYLNENR